MLLTTLRDLQWRLRRFLIAGLGAAMVFALTLLLAGLSSSFEAEAGRTVDTIGADAWVVRTGVEGVFTSVSVVPSDLAAEVARAPGVRRADAIVVMHQTVRYHGAEEINVVGYSDGGLGTPALHVGRLPTSDGDIVADESVGAPLRTRVSVAGHDFTIVGLTQRMTVNGGQPMLFLRLADAQKLYVGGARIANAIVTRGTPTTVPAGYVVRSREDTRIALLRPMEGAIASLRMLLGLLWCVAALVIGSVIYLSALERGRDFAVYKATGWSTRSLAAGLAIQAALVSTLAAGLGVLVAQVLLPIFPLNFQVPNSARLLLPAVGLLVGLLASAAGLRKAVGVDPALAFGGHA